MRTFIVNTEAAAPLITTADAKTFLKVDTSADDTVIDQLVSAATKSAEEYTNRFFIHTVITQYCTNFKDLEELYKSPVDSVAHVKYYDTSNALQTLAATEYTLINQIQPSKIVEAVGKNLPDVEDRLDAVECKYTVGYGTASTDVPAPIIQAVYLTIGHWYQNRQAVIVGRIATELPMSAKYLLDQYKVQVCR